MTISQFWNQDCERLSKKWTFCKQKTNLINWKESWFRIKIHSFAPPAQSSDLRQDILNRIASRHPAPQPKKPRKPRKPKQPKPGCENDPPKKPVRKRKSCIQGNLRARKVKLYPSNNQRKILKEWFGCARFVYNRTIEMLNQNFENGVKNPTCIEYKKINNIDKKDQENRWQRIVPRHIRDEAIQDAYNALSSNIAKKRINQNHHFTLHFKKRKAPSDSIHIDKTAVYLGSRTVYPSKLGKDLFKKKHIRGLTEVEGDCRLVCEHGDQFYLMIIMDKPIISIDNPIVKEDDQRAKKEKIEIRKGNYHKLEPTRAELVALDPGERTFLTGFCPDRSTFFEIAPQDSARICRLCIHLDNMQRELLDQKLQRERFPEYKKRRRHIQRFRKAMQRARNRIKNLVDEMHRKAVHFLVSNYKTILLPEYSTSNMLKKGKRRITSKTARMMATWAHYRFRMRLQSKVEETSDTKLFIVDEAYTTKTCTKCGQLNQTIGGNKVFKCKRCQLVIDRDFNGSRNIALRNLCKQSGSTKTTTFKKASLDVRTEGTMPDRPMSVHLFECLPSNTEN